MVAAYMGEIEFDDPDWINPGEEKIVMVRFMKVQSIEEFLSVGRQWWIHEGPNLVAEAEIIEI